MPQDDKRLIEVAFSLKQGSLVQEGQKINFTETCVVRPDNCFRLHFDLIVVTDLNLRMWRHFFCFPVRAYAGGTARGGGESVTLPDELGEEALLPASEQVVIEGKDVLITVQSSLPLTLIDHRRWGSPEYLLAGYPVGGPIKTGTVWSVDMTTTLAPTGG